VRLSLLGMPRAQIRSARALVGDMNAVEQIEEARILAKVCESGILFERGNPESVFLICFVEPGKSSGFVA
jgi:hypothetical protein